MTSWPESVLPRRRRLQRFGVGLVWLVLQAPILFALMFAGGLVFGWVGHVLWLIVFGTRITDIAVPIGLLVGSIAGIVVNNRMRMWVQRVRLRRLQGIGRSVSAEVIVEEQLTYTRSIDAYIVFVRWRDLDGEHSGDRYYRFWYGAPKQFLAWSETATSVLVRYPPGRPHRFVVEIPYAPSMADEFI